MIATVYLNGSLLPATDAQIGLDDGGLLHGAGLFETMRAEAGRIFRLESHIGRMLSSATKLLRPIDRIQLPSAAVFEDLLRRNGLQHARVRLAGPLSDDAADPAAPTVFATVSPLKSIVGQGHEAGIGVVICQFRQSATDPLAGHKTTSYLPRLLGLREAQAARRGEALWFTTQNRLAEGSISNVFVVRGGVLRTPPLDTPVVPGIARGIVLELATKAGIPTAEEPLTIDDLLDAEEVFLTNAIMQVVPVVHVEKKEIGGGRPGAISRRLLDDYRTLVSQECCSA
jgi:branched-chain amino acid aminotransferase